MVKLASTFSHFNFHQTFILTRVKQRVIDQLIGILAFCEKGLVTVYFGLTFVSTLYLHFSTFHHNFCLILVL